MKRFSAALWLSSAILTFCLTLGTVLCPITAFDIPCTLRPLILACVGFSLVFSLFFTLKRAWIGVLATLTVCFATLWKYFTSVVQALSLACNTVLPDYLAAFDAPERYVVFPTVTPAADALAFSLVLAGLLALVYSWAIARRQSPQLCLIAALPFLALCLIILETVPSAVAILLVAGPLLLLMLSRHTGEYDPIQAAKLRLWMLMPMAALLALLVALSPPEKYQRAAWPDQLRHTISDTAENVSFLRQDEESGQLEFVTPFASSTLGAWSWDSSLEESDLSDVGPMRKSTATVMRVRVDGGGSVYLRGSSMERYENSRWTATPENDLQAFSHTADYLPENPNMPKKIVDIDTSSRANICYLPYYADGLDEGMEWVADAYIKNTGKRTRYSFSAVDPAYSLSGYGDDKDYAAYVRTRYLQLPEEIRGALDVYMAETSVPFPEGQMYTYVAWTWGEFLPRLNLDSFSREDVTMLAEALAATAQAGKTYDLSTPRMPAGEDFTLWFLEESDTGYCVHFAAATTLLLRYAGIPARYVTGYSVSAMDGLWTTVTQGDAHAWVEYYVDGVGWCILEATPGESENSGQTEVEKQDIPTEPEEIPNESEENPTNPNAPNLDIQTNENGTPGTVGTTGAGERPKLPAWILSTAWTILGVCAVCFSYRFFVKYTRKRQFTTGNTNKRAVMLYRHSKKLCKLLQKPVPEEWIQEAERAKFSRHKLTEDEVARFQSRCDELTEQLLQTDHIGKKLMYYMVYVLR